MLAALMGTLMVEIQVEMMVFVLVDWLVYVSGSQLAAVMAVMSVVSLVLLLVDLTAVLMDSMTAEKLV